MDASAIPTLLAMVAIILVLTAIQAIRRPFLRRLAFRNARRRPGEVVLVLIGSLLGTAIITGSYIVGDSLDASLRTSAYAQLGPVDEYAVAPPGASPSTYVQRIRSTNDPKIDSVTALTEASAAFASTQNGHRRAEPTAQMVELDFTTGHDFGGDPAATGISGPTPGPGEAVVGADIADSLDLKTGDHVTGFLYGHRVDLRVRRVLPRLGLAGFWIGQQQVSNNVFVAPGTIAKLTNATATKGASPPTGYVLVSNRGGVISGSSLSAAVSKELRSSLGPRLRVTQIKKNVLHAAKDAGDNFSQLFIGIGTFAVIAGLLLLINIFVMLAEERKSTLGMMRAVGMRRSDLVRGFVIEGVLYALLAAVAGAVFGIAVGWVIVRLASKIFASFGDFSLDFRFHADVASVVGGFCLGMLMGSVTVVVTSIRISRVNIIRAIRDLPEPRLDRIRTRTVILGSVLAAVGGAWFAKTLGQRGAWVAGLLGPVLFVYGLIPLAARLAGRKWPVIGASAFGIAWGVLANSILPAGQISGGGDIFTFVLQGILLTFSAVVLLSHMQEAFETFLRKVAARNLPLRLGLAYPLARRFRTGLTLGMYALVIFTMVFLAVLSVVFGGQVQDTASRAGGGYDMVVTSSATNPPSASQLEAVPGVKKAVPASSGSALFAAPTAKPAEWPTTGIDRAFVAAGPPQLDKTADGMSDQEAWRKVVADPGSMIVDEFFLQQGGGGPQPAVAKPGDRVSAADPISGKRSTRRVVGVTSSDASFAGSYMSKSSLQHVLGPRVVSSRFYLVTDVSAAGSTDLSARLQGRFFRNGVKADTFLSLVEQQASASLSFLRLMQGYLALGLVVGIAGLGIVMIRAVRDRTREIGVLRSLGFLPAQVRRSFLVESGFVALEGIVVGAVLSLVTAAQLVAHGDFGKGVHFMIPWANVTILLVVALAASLLATAWPAQRASKIAPAVALRVAD